MCVFDLLSRFDPRCILDDGPLAFGAARCLHSGIDVVQLLLYIQSQCLWLIFFFFFFRVIITFTLALVLVFIVVVIAIIIMIRFPVLFLLRLGLSCCCCLRLAFLITFTFLFCLFFLVDFFDYHLLSYLWLFEVLSHRVFTFLL